MAPLDARAVEQDGGVVALGDECGDDGFHGGAVRQFGGVDCGFAVELVGYVVVGTGV